MRSSLLYHSSNLYGAEAQSYNQSRHGTSHPGDAPSVSSEGAEQNFHHQIPWSLTSSDGNINCEIKKGRHLKKVRAEEKSRTSGFSSFFFFFFLWNGPPLLRSKRLLWGSRHSQRTDSRLNSNLLSESRQLRNCRPRLLTPYFQKVEVHPWEPCCLTIYCAYTECLLHSFGLLKKSFAARFNFLPKSFFFLLFFTSALSEREAETSVRARPHCNSIHIQLNTQPLRKYTQKISPAAN